MGRDKALLPWRGGLLVEYVASLVASAAGSATLVGEPQRYGDLGLRCIPDVRPGNGPLSGLESALHYTSAERNLILSCDIPDVSPEHLRKLLNTPGDCVITADETGRLHPLCAVYAKSCLAAVSAAIDENRLRLLDLVAQLHPTMARYPGVLRNVNTEEDWAAVH